MSSFFDFDTNKDANKVTPRHDREDLLDGDTAPILCDICTDGRVLVPYQREQLICPNCMHVYDPTFEHIKHDSIELTIDEEADINTGSISYVDSDKPDKLAPTKIRKKLDNGEMPDYVKREIDHIQNRTGYYRHVNKKLFSTTRDRNL